MHSSLCASIFFTFLFNLFNMAATTQCPKNDQLRINCSCFAKYSDESLTWDSAKQNCSNMQSTLASVQSKKVNDLLGRYLTSADNWIGLKAEVNSTLLLPNGEEATFLFPNVNKSSFDTRTCISLRPSNVWTTTDCSAAHRFICHRHKRTNPNISDCPDGWKHFYNYCYWISKAKLIFTEAHQKCNASEAHLAYIWRKEQYDFIRKQLYDKAESIDAWIGLQKAKDSKTKYVIYPQNMVIEPNYTAIGVRFKPDISKECVTMVLAKNDVTWEAKRCDLKLKSYVCQTEIQRDLDITVTDVNETSANISWSVNSSSCKAPMDLNFKLSKGNEIKRQEKIKKKSWLVVNNLQPNRQYTIEITGTNVKKSTEKFETTEIKNPLQFLRHISSSKFHAMIGDSVNLLCAARGEAPITIWWEKDEKKIQSYVETEKPDRSSILTVKLSNQTSYGKYICHIQDRFSNMTRTFVIDNLPKDASDDNKTSFVIAIVILAITVAILLIIIAYFVNYLKFLKRKLVESKKVDTVTLERVSNEGGLYENQPELTAADKIANNYNITIQDENASYTALNRAENEEEDNFYAPLQEEPLQEEPLQEAPLYVNASDFKNTA